MGRDRRPRPIRTSSDRRAQARAVILLAAVVLAASLVRVGDRPATAAINKYQRIDKVFPGYNNANVTFGARGYLDDSCIDHATLTCRSSRHPWKMRPEATAQALAIWFLNAFRGGNLDAVDWEVGPGSKHTAHVEPPGEPSDSCDPRPPTPPDNTIWRIDIVTDRRDIFEVKRWRGPATVGNVNTQLDCYLSKALSRGVEFRASNELAGWASPFLEVSPAWDVLPEVWCVWKPESAVPLGLPDNTRVSGHVYFSPLAETPEPFATRCGGRNLHYANVLLKFFEIAAALGINVVYIKERTKATADRAYRRTQNGIVPYVFSVVQNPAGPRQLTVDWGDGGSESFPIAAGSGVVNVNPGHWFFFGGRYVQRLSVVDTNVLSAAQTAAADGVASTEVVTDVYEQACCSISSPEIEAKWDETGGPDGLLGDLTSNTYSTSYKPGLVQNFQNGNIYSSAATGTHEVHGPILTKYAAIGYEGSVVGFPTSDELASACRSGRYNHFEGGEITSRADLGTFVVYGPTRNKWAALGAECSHFGLPITDQFDSFGAPPNTFLALFPNGRHQYFEGSDIFWNSQNGEVVAYGEGGGITGNYYSDMDTYSSAELRRPDAAIDFDWGFAPPGPTVTADNFIVGWWGRIQIPSSGTYTFSTVSDDGVRLTVCPSPRGLGCGNTYLIDNWTDHTATENSAAPTYLEAGTHHIFVAYYDHTGPARLQLLWSGPGIAKQVVPALYLDASAWGSAKGPMAASSMSSGGPPGADPPAPASPLEAPLPRG